MAISERSLVAATAAENVWRNLRRLSRMFDLTDTEVGQAVGIKRTTLTNKLEGRTPLSVEEALVLSALFGVPFEVLQQDRQEAVNWINFHWDEVEAAIRSRCSLSGWARLPHPAAVAV